MTPDGTALQRALAVAGAALAVVSVPLSYLRVGGAPATLPLPAAGAVDADALVAAAVLAGAAVGLVDHTRGEQLLGTVAGGLAAAVAVAWAAGVDLTAGPGLAVAMVAWGFLEAADLFGPRLSHPRTPRSRPLVAVAVCVAGTVGFLLLAGWVRLPVGVLAVAAWLYAVRWELTASRG